MSALTSDRALVGRGRVVHALVPTQLSYGRETACGYWYPVARLRVTDADVSCKHCLARSVSENKDRQR